MTTPLPVRSVPRIDAVNASSATSTRSATTALSAVVRSNETSLLLGCSSEGNAQCVDSATSLIYEDQATSPASGPSYAHGACRPTLWHRRARYVPCKIAGSNDRIPAHANRFALTWLLVAPQRRRWHSLAPRNHATRP